MKIPRDIDGKFLAKLLTKKYQYTVSRQTGSHLRLTTRIKGEHHITIPQHKPLKAGTLNGILKDIASHLEIEKEDLIRELFYEK